DVAVRGGLDRRAVQRELCEIATQAADGDRGAFTGEVALDLHAWNALQRFGEVEVRELADVLGVDRIGERDVFALRRDRVLQRGAEAGDHDFLDILAGRIGRRRCRRVLRDRAGGDEAGGADTSEQRK